MKKSFILYTDSFEMLKHLSDEQLGRLTRLFFTYQIDGTTPEVSDPLFFPFGFIRATMDRDNQKWEQRADRARTNGTKGGRPKENQQGYQETQETHSVILKPKEPVNVSINVSDTVNVNDNVSVIDSSVRPELKPKSFKSWTYEQFNNSIAQNKELFERSLLLDFQKYWTEPSPSGKLRFQLEKTWDTLRRLERWKSNNFNKAPNKPQQPAQFSRASLNHFV